MAGGERAGRVEKGRTARERWTEWNGRREGGGEKGVLAALGALDKGGVGRSVDEGSG